MKKVLIIFFIIISSTIAMANEFTDYTDFTNIRNIYAKQFPDGKQKPFFDCSPNNVLLNYKWYVCSSYLLPALDNFMLTYYRYIINNIDADGANNIEKSYDDINKSLNECSKKKTDDEVNDCLKNVYFDGVHEMNLLLKYYKNGKFFKLYESVFKDIELDPEPFDFLASLSTVGTINIDGSLKVVNKKRIKPTFNCEKSRTLEERTICQSDYLLPILDRFYSQYYSYIYNNVNEEDKKAVKGIGFEMMKARASCRYNDMFEDKNVPLCIRYAYSDALYKLSFLLLSSNGKYDYIYELVFGSNPLLDNAFWRSGLFLGKSSKIKTDGGIDFDSGK